MTNTFNNITNNIKALSTLLGLLFLSFSAFTQTTTLPSIFDIMNYQEVLEVTMEGNFEAFKNERRSGDAQVITLSFADATGKTQTWKLEATLRGHFRRMRCTAIPPLKLNFKKSALKEAGLAKFDDMKLVTQCMEDAEDGKDAVLKEYLAYKLYNGLTEESFRVQLLKITYKDTVINSSTESWGFIIEDTAQLTARLAAEKTEQERGTNPSDYHKDGFYKMAVFQYMIGNGDWDILGSRNVKVLKKEGKNIAIPYDFDFSGLVDASYAIPNGNYGMTSVQDRVYMGFAEDIEHLDATLELFNSQKSAIKDTVKNFKLLKSKYRREVLIYLDTFFDTMDKIEYRAKKAPIVLGAQID